MNLRKFRKATAKKRLLDNHKGHKDVSGKKKRKKSDPNVEIEDLEEEKFEETIDTSESNTMTLEQFTDIVLASEGMFSYGNIYFDRFRPVLILIFKHEHESLTLEYYIGNLTVRGI